MVSGRDDRPCMADVVSVESSSRPASGEAGHGAEYAELSRFFDDFSGSDERWQQAECDLPLARYSGFRRLVVPPGHSVLEIGSGTAICLLPWHPLCGVGVDVSPRMVERARRRATPSWTFQVAEGERIDLGTDVRFHRALRSRPLCPRPAPVVRPHCRALPPSDARGDQLLQPDLASPARACRTSTSEATQTDPKLGVAV